MKKNDGGPAFPGMTGEYPGTTHPGMTLRDYFAGHALAGMMASDANGSAELFAKSSYMLADAMLAERNR